MINFFIKQNPFKIRELKICIGKKGLKDLNKFFKFNIYCYNTIKI